MVTWDQYSCDLVLHTYHQKPKGVGRGGGGERRGRRGKEKGEERRGEEEGTGEKGRRGGRGGGERNRKEET